MEGRKWISLEDFGSGFPWNLPTLVGKYINLDCYQNNFKAEEN